MIDRSHAYRWAGRLARWVIAGVFLYAGISKALDPTLLARQIKNYHLAPWWLVHPLAIVLPWLEITCALLLVLGIWVSEAASIIGVLTVLFITAIGWALYWDLSIQCGCFSRYGMASWPHMVGNAALLLLTIGAVILNRRSGKLQT